jgi:hypothetical protein
VPAAFIRHAAMALIVLLVAPGLAHAQAAGGNAPSLETLFKALDKNADGKIARDEATGNYAQRFPQWDADGDGFATREEIRKYRASLGIDDDGKRAGAGAAQNNRGQRRAAGATATILKEPADWRLETIPLPPGFAPDIRLKGQEEIRFAPGMFNTSAPDYFTCVIAIAADGAPEPGTDDVKDFLEKYYRGLSTGLAQRKGLKVEPDEMRATVKPAAEAKNRYLADVVFFDSFSDGRKVTLHVEAQIIAQPAAKKTLLLLLVSPSAKDAAVWKTLREVEANTVAALNESK